MEEIEVGCQSCHRTTRQVGRWSPILRKGAVVGYTCPACPKYGEPIRRTVTRSGAVRFRVTLDIGADKAGKRRQETRVVITLAEARSYVRVRGAEIRAEQEAGRMVGGRDRATVNEMADRWLEAKRGDVREVTREMYEHSLKPVRRFLGTRQVQSLSHADVVALRTWLTNEGGSRGQGLGVQAAKASLSRLKQVLDYAVVEGIVSANVARGVTPPKSHDPEAVSLERWTASELVAFTRHADNDRHAAAWRLATLGMRREEILGLTWDAVDLDAGTIIVRQTRVAVSRSTDPRGWMLGRTKSPASRRTIRPDDVQPGTMSALRRLKMSSPPNDLGLVVLDELGEPVGPKAFSSRFAAMAREAGVPVIHLHSTRHTVAYLLHDAGLAPVRAAAFLGHTLTVHLDTYLFARADDVDVAGAALGKVLDSAAVGS